MTENAIHAVLYQLKEDIGALKGQNSSILAQLTALHERIAEDRTTSAAARASMNNRIGVQEQEGHQIRAELQAIKSDINAIKATLDSLDGTANRFVAWEKRGVWYAGVGGGFFFVLGALGYSARDWLRAYWPF